MSERHDVDVLHYQLRSKVLEGDEKELYELSLLAGVKIDPHVFKILMDLLKLNVSPVALAGTLRSIGATQRGDASAFDSSLGQHNRTTSSDSSGGQTAPIPSSSASHTKRSRSNIAMRSNHSTSDLKDHRSSRRSRLPHH